MAIEARRSPHGGKVIPGKEGSQGYTGSYVTQAFGAAAPVIAAHIPANIAELAATAGGTFAGGTAGVAATGSVALGPFGIALVGLGATFLGSAIDWLIGKKTQKKPTPPKVIPQKPQRKQLTGSAKAAPMKSPDYASLDPGRQQLVPNSMRQAAANRILSSPTFTQRTRTTPAFGGRV